MYSLGICILADSKEEPHHHGGWGEKEEGGEGEEGEEEAEKEGKEDEYLGSPPGGSAWWRVGVSSSVDAWWLFCL